MDWNKRRQRLATVLRKAVAFHSHPTEETFPELPDVLVWFRFSLAVAYGLYLGLSGVRSSVYVLQALNLITFVPVLYCRLYLGISDFAGASSTLSSTSSSSSSSSSFGSQIVFAGTMNALALTLLLWIYFFTAQHEDDERKLASLLVAISKDDTTIKPENFVETTIVNGGMTAAGGEAAGMTPKGVTDDPEF